MFRKSAPCFYNAGNILYAIFTLRQDRVVFLQLFHMQPDLLLQEVGKSAIITKNDKNMAGLGKGSSLSSLHNSRKVWFYDSK